MALKLHGVIPALVTPRVPDRDEVDYPRLSFFVRHLLDCGVHGVFATGSTGEAPLLSHSQRKRVIETVVETVNGIVPVMAGVGSASTAESIRLAHEAEDAGATHISILPMHFFPTMQDELYKYFADVSGSVKIPSVLYNYPSRCGGLNIEAELVAHLARMHNVVGIKDSSGDLDNTLRYIQQTQEDFGVFAGPEALIEPIVTAGGAGTICAGANVFPKKLIALYEAAFLEDTLDAQRRQQELLPLQGWGKIGTFPAAVKAALAFHEQAVGDPFLPVMPLSPREAKALEAILAQIGPDKP
jgi:4-hydroxy-tetrahydrodipicolinate synthase